jgi:hypothetical protein
MVFVVKESDVDIFESLDDLDCFLSPKPTATASSKKTSHPSSICSSNSSNSSVCSKSSNFDDESLLPFSEHSHSSSGTARGSEHRRSSRRRRRKKQRSVEFNPRIKVRRIPHVQDASEDELTERWYREDELAGIKQKASETLRRIKADEVPNDGEELRGSHRSKKQQRRSLWVMALTCVLDEQKRQARDKVHDPETIAKLYRSFAFSSVQIAQVLGRQDAEAAREIYSSAKP